MGGVWWTSGQRGYEKNGDAVAVVFGGAPCAIHALGVEGEGDIADGIDGNQAPGSVHFEEPFMNDLRCGDIEGLAEHFHSRGDIAGHGGTDELLAVAGARDGA